MLPPRAGLKSSNRGNKGNNFHHRSRRWSFSCDASSMTNHIALRYGRRKNFGTVFMTTGLLVNTASKSTSSNHTRAARTAGVKPLVATTRGSGTDAGANVSSSLTSDPWSWTATLSVPMLPNASPSSNNSTSGRDWAASPPLRRLSMETLRDQRCHRRLSDRPPTHPTCPPWSRRHQLDHVGLPSNLDEGSWCCFHCRGQRPT